MLECNVCEDGIEEDHETHITVVKPVEYKGSTQKIRHYYCSVSCLVDHARS